MAETNTCMTLPALPLKNTVLFPHLLMPLVVGRTRSLSAVEAAWQTEEKLIVVLAQKDLTVEDPNVGDLFSVGTTAVLKHFERTEDRIQVVVQGTSRAEVCRVEQEQPHLRFHVRLLTDPQDQGMEIEALHGEVLETAGQIHQMLDPQSQINLSQMLNQIQEPLHQVYLLASMLGLGLEKEQMILAAPTRLEALRLMHGFLAHEVQVRQLRQKIANQAMTEMGRQQREHILRQQLREIQQELGETNAEEADVAELRRRMDEAGLPESVVREADKELNRLQRMMSASPEYQVTRGYLDLVLDLPWNKTTEDLLDLDRAQTVLDEDHFDLAEVKQRIIEHLAVMKLNPAAKAPILCFVGPPGVGKTSLGQSIARAINRKFERMSLGGLHDEAELRGHRRTYIGAMPGRIVQAIRRAGVRNPLLMLDEIDKLGHDYRGDPAAALLEILDPAQNWEFRDNFLDLPFDLSKVFFVTTANSLDGIPGPLLDRMEMLHLAGYSDDEKRQIARRYLLPRRLAEAGIAADRLSIPDETIDCVIRRYTREAGVRELERLLGRITRKIAIRFVRGDPGPVAVRVEDLSEILGPERFFRERARASLAPGVATGLAWTEKGGEVLYVEAVLLPDGGDKLTLTGQLGEVMQESAKAAQSYVWSKADELEIDKAKFRESAVHIHIPAGAIPKDGPSAGVTMATVLASLYTDLPVRGDTAMTGEITLSGLVLPVGGIKEKVLAAHRAGIRHLIVPKDNRQDLPELPDHVRHDIEFTLAERIEDVLSAAIPAMAERLAAAYAM